MSAVKILDDQVSLYQRPESAVWQCSAMFNGKRHRASTKQKDLSAAKEKARSWYYDLHNKVQAGVDISEKTFADAAKRFELEYEVITEGSRSPKYVQSHKDRLRLHLLPFFGNKRLSEVTPTLVQDYRIFRRTSAERPPSRSQLRHEEVTLRQVLKTAVRCQWLPAVPDISMPYSTNHKVSHRAWFSPEEYKRLYQTTRARALDAEGRHYHKDRLQLHDYVLFMANTGLRPDEANLIRMRDVEIIDDEATGETILLISVRGKRGVGYCKSTKGGVFPFRRMVERNQYAHNDLLFPGSYRKQFNNVLDELDMKVDGEGNRRSAYSLRHTYICLRLMEGADVYAVAKNCRTSVEMIEKHYAVHIANMLDASAINVKRQKR